MRSPSMASSSISREVRAEHQRERVLKLATEVFAKRGYEGTTIDGLLAAGGVGVSNFYSLFKGKEECFLAVLDRAEAAARTRIESAVAGSAGWSERAYLGLGAAFGFLAEEPSAARVLLLEAQSAGPAGIAHYNRLLDAGIDWLRTGRGQGGNADALPPGFEQAAISGLGFYLQQCLLGSVRRTPAELLAEAAELLLEPVLGARELKRVAGMPLAAAI